MARVLLLCVLLCGLRLAGADEAPSGAAAAPMQTTTVLGAAPPSFPGRWLVVATVDLPDKQQSMALFWQVADTAGAPPSVILRLVALPDVVQAHLDAANTAATSWVPTPDDLRAIAVAWDRLTPLPSQPIATITTELATPSGYDDAVKGVPALKDARWLVRQRKQFLPSAKPAMGETHSFGVETAAPGDLTGAFEGVTVIATPILVPIRLTGRFHAFEVGAQFSSGWLARFADLFSGCARH